MTNKYGPWIAFNEGDKPPADDVMVQAQCETETRKDVIDEKPWASKDLAWSVVIAYRILQQPVRGKVVKYVDDKRLFSEQHYRHDTHRVTFPTDDGQLIPGTYTGPDGAQIKIEVLK